MALSLVAVRVEAGGWTGVKIPLRTVLRFRTSSPPVSVSLPLPSLLNKIMVLPFLGCRTRRHRRRLQRSQTLGNPDDERGRQADSPGKKAWGYGLAAAEGKLVAVCGRSIEGDEIRERFCFVFPAAAVSDRVARDIREESRGKDFTCGLWVLQDSDIDTARDYYREKT